MLNHLPRESAQKQCTHFYCRFWTEGKTDLRNSCKTGLEWRPASAFKNVKHLGYGKQAGCVTRAKTSLRRGAETRFMGQAKPWLQRPFYLKGESAWRMLRHAPNRGLTLLSPHQSGQATKGDTLPEHEVLWGINGKYRAMTEDSVLPSITLMDVASKNCPCCRRSRCWWSVVQTLSNPKSAWKRQHNSQSVQPKWQCWRWLVWKSTTENHCRNSYCEGL